MKVVFSEKAEDQFRTIQAAFREISQERAAKFADEVRRAVWRLARFPRSGQEFATVRRVVLRQSHFLMLYQIANNEVRVTKLVHQKRKRDYE